MYFKMFFLLMLKDKTFINRIVIQDQIFMNTF